MNFHDQLQHGRGRISRDAFDQVADRRIFVEKLRFDAFIGCYEHEQKQRQPIIVSYWVDVFALGNPLSDSLEDALCYDRLARGVQTILDEGHIKLVETLAERIAAMIVGHPMAARARVRVEKPDAIANAGAAGVEIVRWSDEFN